jgi:4'-phosphopantetheinyl transferase
MVMGHDRPWAAHVVQLWAASLEPERHEAARRLAATTDAERERASRFLRPDGAERYLSAHGALRLILADYLMCDPVALRFGAHENGKPFLEGARLEFNLSHSATLALIAVARDRRVGVDVEQVRPMTDVDEVAARVCTP